VTADRFKVHFIAISCGLGLAGFAFMIKLMYDMTGFVGEMTAHISSMSQDMSAMYNQVAILTSEVSKIDDVVANMDGNINAINMDINVIQRSISEDMFAMNQGVYTIAHHLHAMDKNMAYLTTEVSKLDDLMNAMGTDIHHGTRSFTSPMYYMWNMMQ
jgi:prophage DNA circulation protein